MRAVPIGGQYMRVADPLWADPTDASFAADTPGRWNPAGVDCLYLNDDIDTARANVRHLFVGQAVQPEDLDPRSAPVLVWLDIPAGTAADGATPAGLAAVGLPATYPLDDMGLVVSHATCQAIGEAAHTAGHDGVFARSAAPGGNHELAWFARGRIANVEDTEPFDEWY